LKIIPLRDYSNLFSMKFNILIGLFLVFGVTGFSQTPAIEWQHSYGGTEYQHCLDVLETDDGGFIGFSNTTSDDGDISLNHGQTDVWVFKTDNTGGIEWEKSFGGSEIDAIRNALKTNDGGYIFCGLTDSNDYDVSGNHGDYDFWVVKMNATGDILWQKCFGSFNEDQARDISPTADGGYIVTGYTFSIVGQVTGNHGQSDVWVVKLSADGTIEWKKCYGGTSADKGTAAIQTADGGYAIIGEAKLANGDITSNHGLLDIWVIKVNATGIIEWQKTYGGTANDMGISIVQNADGGYTMMGETSSSDGDITGHHGGKDIWVAGLDTLGNILWGKALGGSDWETPSHMQSAGPNFIISAETSSSDGDVSGFPGYYNCWVVKVNNQGTILWEKSIGGGDQDGAYNAHLTTDGGCIVAAVNLSHGGDAIPGGIGVSNAWLIKLAPDNLNTEAPVKNNITIYPNPVTSLLNIRADDISVLKKADIYDLSGKLLLSPEIGLNAIDISSLASGIYLLNITGEDINANFRFIKL
jgi:type IX secretion system substrate protein